MTNINKNRFKKITVWGLVFCAVFNSIGFISADNTDIAKYCEKELGPSWSNFDYNPDENEYKNKKYSELNDEYHQDINDLFAESIQKMLDVIETETSLDQICTDKLITKKVRQAITTYEISQKALCRYARYKGILNAKLNYIATQDINNPDVRAFLDDTDHNLQFDTFQALQLFREQVETELDIARVSIDKTLAIYDEMIIMYPLHLRFRCIISDLLIFRNHLAKLVNIFFCLERYINAGSDKLD